MLPSASAAAQVAQDQGLPQPSFDIQPICAGRPRPWPALRKAPEASRQSSNPSAGCYGPPCSFWTCNDKFAFKFEITGSPKAQTSFQESPDLPKTERNQSLKLIISKTKSSQEGEVHDEVGCNVAGELVVTWIRHIAIAIISLAIRGAFPRRFRLNSINFYTAGRRKLSIAGFNEASQDSGKPDNTSDFFEENAMDQAAWIKVQQGFRQLVSGVKWLVLLEANLLLNLCEFLTVNNIRGIDSMCFKD
ncbi:MAG: hypothetical protein CJBNEKGG_03899 [Prosthecobacter sp.]|nr:hypothetical protein [Prosthecobacter sp.]